MLKIENYKLYRADRRVGRGGGVCMYIKESVATKQISPINTEIEQLWIEVKFKKQIYAIGTVYRPPSYSVVDFLNCLELNIIDMLPKYDEIICLGDFNIDMLRTESSATIKLNKTLESLGLVQLVSSPTRNTPTSSTLIDLILATSNDGFVNSCSVIPADRLSDHDLTSIELNITHSQSPAKYKKIRSFKNFDLDCFYAELCSMNMDVIYNLPNINDKIEVLNSNILKVLNKHAPIRTIKITKPYSPWMTDNIKFLIFLRNKAKSRWRRTKNISHYDYYKMLRNYTTTACRNEKKAYYDDLAKKQGMKKVWSNLKYLNIGKQKSEIPETLKNPTELNKYYVSCIPRLEAKESVLKNIPNKFNANADPFSFEPIAEEDVERHILNIKTNAKGVDGICVKLILMCCPLIVPFLTHIVNHCLINGVFPDCWKVAVVLPIPKKNKPLEYKDLRPINILPVVSKILEKVAENQLRHHIMEYTLLPTSQSGFRPLHSCETALLNVTDDIFRALDAKKATVLVLLDFSKAFDTLNHDILIAILQSMGISNISLDFFRSYLSGRCQMVQIEGESSDVVNVSHGVPQGSVLGPLLFTLYTASFPDVVQHSNINMYADDTQLHISFDQNPDECRKAIQALNKDLAAVLSKAEDLCLTINASKTSVLLFAPRQLRDHLKEHVNVIVDNQIITVSDSARNLGLSFDSVLRFKPHVNNCIKNAYLNIKMLYPHRHVFSAKVKTALCESYVLSRFNYADVVYGPCLDAEDARRIQVVQNSCLRLIFGIRRRQAITHKLKDCGWLSMSDRRLLHAATVFQKIILHKQPAYLHNKIRYRTDIHNLNLRLKNLITPPLHRTENFKRSFTYQIAHVYGLVPGQFKSMAASNFKNHYKKYIMSNKSGRSTV
nr:unnamed protein product [Callosobruchus chinensis]